MIIFTENTTAAKAFEVSFELPLAFNFVLEKLTRGICCAHTKMLTSYDLMEVVFPLI